MWNIDLLSSQCDHDLLHSLVVLPFEVFGPSVMSAAIEVWTWVIAERPDMEIALVMETFAAWESGIRKRKGVFSESLEYVVFNRPTEPR